MEPHSGVLDIERGQASGILQNTWQTDTSVSNKSWGYIQNDTFKTSAAIVKQLADIVSKNGNLLLNIGPRADGTIPEEVQKVLLDVGGWLNVNGDAIYGTRPWTKFGEGPTEVKAGSFHDTDTDSYTPLDFRFTTKGNSLYAIQMDCPSGEEAVIRSLRSDIAGSRGVTKVTLLGASSELPFTQRPDGLHIRLSGSTHCTYAAVYRIQFDGTPQ
jgi:alpha-L-fucosidase